MKRSNFSLLVALVMIVSISLASCNSRNNTRVVVNYTVYRLIGEYSTSDIEDLVWEPQYTTTGAYYIRLVDKAQLYNKVRAAVWENVLESNSKYIPDSIRINNIVRE